VSEAEKERAAIVRLMRIARKEADNLAGHAKSENVAVMFRAVANTMAGLAFSIERGEHLRDNPEGDS
jgi:divalent metal cation (Fe/Co/Zn/Cd) transporter